MLLQILPQLRTFDLIQTRQQGLHATELSHQLFSSLLPYSRYAGNVVRAVTHQPQHIDDPSGPTPKRSRTSATPRRWSFIVSRMVIWSVTNWQRSLSPVTRTTSHPSISKRRASVPRMSSASYPARLSLGMSSASTRRWI